MGDIVVGTIIGGYQILEAVGEGGMATVYRAHQLSMNRDVAIKVLPRQFLRQSNSLDRFKQEANIVARLEHRAIVPVHDYGEYEGVPYLVMRHMDGGSVDDLLAEGPVPLDRTLEIVMQIAPALDYAHHNGVLHRDLKPSNILLDANGDAYITDFGIARLLGEGSTSLTTTGVVGTPSYMSPEQAQGQTLDGRSDVYALGVVLFEMLAGSRPFEGETPYSVAVKHVTEKPPSVRQFNSQLSSAIEQVLFKALEKQPGKRYQSARELAEALKAAMAVPAESMIETEPSLEKSLDKRDQRPRLDTSGALLSNPVPRSAGEAAARAQSPDIQIMQPYVVPPSGTYPLAARSSRLPARSKRRLKSRRNRGQSGWAIWTAAVLVVVSVMLALGVTAAYYVFNDTEPVAEESNLSETAIYKMTATKQAIIGDIATPKPASTAPPTNTSHPVTMSSPPTQLLPFVATENAATGNSS